MKSLVSRAVGSALELVFPSSCVHCGRERALLCEECLSTASSLGENLCRKCALPMARPSTCARCAASPPAVDRMLAAYQMDGPVRSAVHALKYEGLRAIAPQLGSLLDAVKALERIEIDIVIPVPLHPSRLRERGFNQAALLGNHVAKARGWTMDERVLKRLRHTPPQVSTSNESERALAMVGAFGSTDSLDGANVLLVDDVVTTGSTVNSAAGALKGVGANRVTVLALAREL